MVKTTTYKYGQKSNFPSVFNETDHFPEHAKKSYELSIKIMKDLRFDGKTINIVSNVIRYHAERVQVKDSDIRIFAYSLGYDLFNLWTKVRIADVASQNIQYYKKREEKVHLLKKIFNLCKKKGELITIKDLEINGNDVMALGFSGKIVGEILNECLMICLESPLLNDRQYLLSYIMYKYL